MQFLSVAFLPFLLASSLTGVGFPKLELSPKEQEVSSKAFKVEEEKEARLVCEGCNVNEKTTVEFLQDQGVTDKNAIATVMGNIRQESSFFPNICEGGARVGYHGCHYGGYGLIQWTSTNRYRGLGSFANRYGGNPSTLDTQLRYMVNEVQWKRIKPKMMTPGKSIEAYMNYAYSWIGWGHHGARTYFAYDYARRLKVVEA